VPREVAAKTIGQPLGLFLRHGTRARLSLGELLRQCIFRREDPADSLPSLTPVEAHEEYLAALPETGRRWLSYCNSGRVHGYPFNNPRLTRKALGLPHRHVDPRMRALAAIWWLSRRESPRLQRLHASITARRGLYGTLARYLSLST
jgi:hypothetical protein